MPSLPVHARSQRCRRNPRPAFRRAVALALLGLLLAACSPSEDPLTPARVDRIADKGTLVELARGHPEIAVRIAAIRKLSDQPALVEIALEGGRTSEPTLHVSQKYLNASKAATDRVGDPEQLLRIALQARNWAVRQYATTRLADELDVVRVALEADAPIRDVAVARLTRPPMLVRVILESANLDTAWNALRRLRDPAAAADVALQAKCGLIRWQALHRVTGERELARIAEQASDPALRAAAASRAFKGSPASAPGEERFAALPAKKLRDILANSQGSDEATETLLASFGGALLRLADEIDTFPDDVPQRIFLRLDVDDPAVLRRLLRRWDRSASSWVAMAKVRLALHDPVVARRLPRRHAAFAYQSSWLLFSNEERKAAGEGVGRLRGENIQVTLRAGACEISETYVTKFPHEQPADGPRPQRGFVSASIDLPKLLARLLSEPSFHPEDLAEIERTSELVELSAAASMVSEARAKGESAKN